MATKISSKKRNEKIGRGIVYLLLVLISIVSIVPLYWMFRSALMSNAEIFIFPPRIFPDAPQWDNFIKAFQAFDAVKYFGNTLKIVIPCVIGTVLTSAMCGYALARLKFPGKKFWFISIIGAMILPNHAVLIPMYLTYSRLGLVDTYWPFWLGAWFGGGAANIFLMRQFMLTIPKDYDEAAIVDGANRMQIFFRILFPMLTPILITVGVFAFMNYWNDFFNPLLYLHSENKYTLALGLLTLSGSYASKWNYIMAASLTMVVPAIVIFGIGQRYFVEGIALTGVKG